MNGVNAYNRRIAEQRLQRWTEKACSLPVDFMTGIDYDGAALFLLGDIVSGDIHAELRRTNADTIAQELAKGLSHDFDISLVYSFDKAGVLLDADDDATVIHEINPSYYKQLKTKQKIFEGMIHKLDNAFAALSSGVKKVIIGKAEKLEELIAGRSGTTIINE
jgi:acetylglutamate kinase